MVRIRRLQRKDEHGRWYTDAYAIETPDGHVRLRYPLSWEYLGAQYNAEISKQRLSLERLGELLSSRKLRWLAVETLVVDDDQALSILDRECNIPTMRKAVATRES